MAIAKQYNSEGLPISVIIPASMSRLEFLVHITLPSIRANHPAEIVINDDDGRAPEKRNAGFDASTQPYVFFCDDDIWLPDGYLSRLLSGLKEHQDNASIGYAYTGYVAISFNPNRNPAYKKEREYSSIAFHSNRLLHTNYISTMSLMRRQVFPYFDARLRRLQDWDLYLNLLSRNITGVAVKGQLFEAYYLDKGITSNDEWLGNAYALIASKYGHLRRRSS